MNTPLFAPPTKEGLSLNDFCSRRPYGGLRCRAGLRRGPPVLRYERVPCQPRGVLTESIRTMAGSDCVCTCRYSSRAFLQRPRSSRPYQGSDFTAHYGSNEQREYILNLFACLAINERARRSYAFFYCDFRDHCLGNSAVSWTKKMAVHARTYVLTSKSRC